MIYDHNKKTVSLIVPCFNEEKSLPILYEKLTKLWQDELPDYNYELVFVDDGSIDESVKTITKIAKKDRQVKLIQFTRNFGKEIATTAGINHCTGDACMIVDADMQYPIQKIPEFIRKWNKGKLVVIGVRDQKQTNNIIEKLGSYWFYKILNGISQVKVVQPGALDFRLLDREVIKDFNRFTERERMTRALIDWLGYDYDFVYYKERKRRYGTASYSFIKRVRLAVHTFISHSLFPLKLAGYLGIFITLASSFVGIFALINQFIHPKFLPFVFSGTFLLGILNSFLIGVVLISLGLIALYIANIHIEVTNRPLYVIRKKLNYDNEVN